MSLRRSWSTQRSRLFGPVRTPASLPQALVGRDFAGSASPARRPAGLLGALVVGAMVAALLATSLRVEILRQRYALGEAVKLEASLLERTRTLTVARRELRDPRQLRRLAEQRGFVRPARVIRLGAGESRGTLDR